MVVKVREVVGKSFSSRTEGKKMRAYITRRWQHYDQITIDFEGLDVASVSFLDEAFGRLSELYTIKEMKSKLSFIGLDSDDRKLLNYIIISRLKEKESLDTEES
jgi:hypothetical protein